MRKVHGKLTGQGGSINTFWLVLLCFGVERKKGRRMALGMENVDSGESILQRTMKENFGKT